MCFRSSKFRDISVPSFYINGKAIELVECHKYLGVWLTSDLKDDMDIVRQTRYVYASGNSLIRKFKDCSPEVKAQLFKSYCCSVYCSSLWSTYSKSSFCKLNVAFKRIFRGLLKIKGESITGVMVQLGVNPLQVILRKLVNGFRTRVLQSSNNVVYALVNSMHFNSSLILKRWNDILFLLN